jgi:hypothetical protein
VVRARGHRRLPVARAARRPLRGGRPQHRPRQMGAVARTLHPGLPDGGVSPRPALAPSHGPDPENPDRSAVSRGGGGIHGEQHLPAADGRGRPLLVPRPGDRSRRAGRVRDDRPGARARHR